MPSETSKVYFDRYAAPPPKRASDTLAYGSLRDTRSQQKHDDVVLIIRVFSQSRVQIKRLRCMPASRKFLFLFPILSNYTKLLLFTTLVELSRKYRVNIVLLCISKSYRMLRRRKRNYEIRNHNTESI